MHQRTEIRRQGELKRTLEVYACSDCMSCTYKAKCLYQYDEEKDTHKNKTMKVNEVCEELKAKSHKNIQSEKGIHNRQIRSIQTEGHFGDIKEKTSSGDSTIVPEKKCTKNLCFWKKSKQITSIQKRKNQRIKEYEGKTAEVAA